MIQNIGGAGSSFQAAEPERIMEELRRQRPQRLSKAVNSCVGAGPHRGVGIREISSKELL